MVSSGRTEEKKGKVLMICDCHPRICGIRLDHCPGDLSSLRPMRENLVLCKIKDKEFIEYEDSPSISPSDFLIVILCI